MIDTIIFACHIQYALHSPVRSPFEIWKSAKVRIKRSAKTKQVIAFNMADPIPLFLLNRRVALILAIAGW